MSEKISFPRQLIYQALCLLIAFIVLFPILWVVGMSINARDEYRPKDIFPPPDKLTLAAYKRVLDKPTNNPVTFLELARNSLLLSGGVALASVAIGVTSAYVFARFNFRGRQVLMMSVITVLMLPSVATLAPLFVLLNRVSFDLRNSLVGVGLAMTSGALPFAIWNLKGYLDTIPRDLEEAAIIDGASPNQVFTDIILPLSLPALAVTVFLGFQAGWTEFAMSWQFLTNPKDFTLAMALWNMIGQFSGDTPWSAFAAMSIMVAAPIAIVYLLLQRYFVSGLTVGSVK